MSVETSGCVITKEKDVFKVASVIDQWWRNLREKEGLRPFGKAEGWQSPHIHVSGANQSVHVFFQFKGEDRRLFVVFDCDYDLSILSEIVGDSCIWMDLGCWGSSVEIMESLLIEFRKQELVERCYIDENDSDDEGYKEI